MSGAPDVRRPALITAREHLEEVVAELRGFASLGFDTESNGFYAHHEKVCLIQISSPEADYILDPIAVRDISILGPIFADPAIEKIFHAAEYDLIGLKRDYDFDVRGIFDTMIAGKFLGWKELGLAKAIEKHFGVVLSKKLQKADWGKRPLSDEHLRYAQMDTYFLIELSKIQRGLLAERGRWEDAAEAFLELEAVTLPNKEFNPEGFWSMTGARAMSGEQRAALREIYLLREAEAERRDQAPFRVMSEDFMVRLATELPRDKGSLARIKGASPYVMERLGDKIISAVRRGLSGPPVLEEPPRSERARRNMRQERVFERLRQWRKQRAEEEQLDPGAILSASVLQEMARRSAAGEDALAALAPVKRRRYEESLRRILGE